MILTDSEAQKIFQNEHCNISADLAGILCRAIEAELLEKLKAQEPDAWRTFDGEGGYDYRSYVDNEKYQAEFLARNPSSTYKNWVEPLYLHPLPPADVVRDAERLDWIQANCRCDPMMDGQHKWWPTNFNKCLTGPSIREAIDKAMKEMK